MQPFDNTFPTPTETLAASQPKFLSNNMTLPYIYGHDHFGLDIVTEPYQGRHKFLTIPTNLPLPTPGANEMALYVKLVGGQPEYFMRRNGSLTEYQLTSGGYPAANPGFPSVRASVRFQGQTGAISYGYNVSSITVSLPLNYQLNFTNALSNANYYISALVEENTASVASAACVTNTDRTTAHCSVLANISSSKFIQVVVFGT